MWEVIGGAVEDNESPEESIKREVMEEINCNIYNLKFFKTYIVYEDKNRYILIVFTGKIKEKIKCNKEIEVVKWINKDEIEKFDFCGNDLEKLEDYFYLNSQTGA